MEELKSAVNWFEIPTRYLNGGADLAVVLDRVANAGGTVIQEKTEVSPEIGYMAIIDDSEGNRIHLHSMN